MEYLWCLLILKTLYVVSSAFPLEPSPHSYRHVRQLGNYWNNPFLSSLTGGSSAAGATAGVANGQAVSGAGAGGVGTSAGGAGIGSGLGSGLSSGLGSGLSSGLGSGLSSGLGSGLGVFNNPGYAGFNNPGFGSGYGGAPLSTGFNQGASQTDSFTNSASHNTQNSQNINVDLFGKPLVNVGLSNSNSESASNSGSRTQSVNQYGNTCIDWDSPKENQSIVGYVVWKKKQQLTFFLNVKRWISGDSGFSNPTNLKISMTKNTSFGN
ncbi:hypothetical protein WDU94_005384 [Cyamophila willieti]